MRGIVKHARIRPPTWGDVKAESAVSGIEEAAALGNT